MSDGSWSGSLANKGGPGRLAGSADLVEGFPDNMRLIHRDEVPETGVSHDPEIRKRLLLPAGVVPKLTNFSQSVLKPGQRCSAHTHPDMWEIYLVESGQGLMRIDGEEVALSPGACLVVEPGEEHALQNASADEELRLTYFGIEGELNG